jgi:mevalonate kinase
MPRGEMIEGLSVRLPARARLCLTQKLTSPCPSLASRPQALIKENHEHLAALGVSHPSLEEIIALTKASPYELSTKLTGAGGGGCAVTLLPDGPSPLSLPSSDTVTR